VKDFDMDEGEEIEKVSTDEEKKEDEQMKDFYMDEGEETEKMLTDEEEITKAAEELELEMKRQEDERLTEKEADKYIQTPPITPPHYPPLAQDTPPVSQHASPPKVQPLPESSTHTSPPLTEAATKGKTIKICKKTKKITRLKRDDVISQAYEKVKRAAKLARTKKDNQLSDQVKTLTNMVNDLVRQVNEMQETKARMDDFLADNVEDRMLTAVKGNTKAYVKMYLPKITSQKVEEYLEPNIEDIVKNVVASVPLVFTTQPS